MKADSDVRVGASGHCNRKEIFLHLCMSHQYIEGPFKLEFLKNSHADDHMTERSLSKRFCFPDVPLSPSLGKFGQLMFWNSFWEFEGNWKEIGNEMTVQTSKEAKPLLRILYLI